MKKKLAILIRGQSQNIFYSHKKIKILDYKNFNNQYEDMIKKFDTDYEIDIFMHTFKSKYLNENEIINYYKPKAYNITESFISENTKCQSEIGKNIYFSLKNVIELYFNFCTQESIKYDLILIMRFDWFPNDNIDLNKINSNYFNVYGVFEKNKKIFSDDNILLTSHENLKEYNNALEKCKKLKIGNLHFIVQYLDKSKIFDLLKNELI